jgi:VanZ family protein
MLIIFSFSAQPSSNLPDLYWADRIVKKGGHMLGYALLAVSYWWALRFREEKQWIAWLLAFAYAVTDEFHQSLVPGRQASVWDVVIFDQLGALIALGLASRHAKQKRPDAVHPIVGQTGR